MQKTSRRNFGKLIAGAVAAFPLASCTSPSTENQNAQPSAGETQREKQAAQQPRPEEAFSHQDTPPPMILEEGSLKVDVRNANLGAGDEFPKESANNYRWEYPDVSKDIYIVGMQIVSVAGKVWFYLDRDSVENTKVPLNVVIHMEGTGGSKKEVVLSTDKMAVTLKFPPGRVLKKKYLSGSSGPTEPGYGGRIRYRYFDTSGPETGRIEAITVFLGSVTDNNMITRFDRGKLGAAMDGVRVMFWFEAT
jgi:hypothetical protein